LRKSFCLLCGQCSVERQDKKQKDSQEATERIQMRDNGDLNCGFYSEDFIVEKIQISGYISELWELVIIRIWGIY